MTKSDHRSLRQLTGRAKTRYVRALTERLGAPANAATLLDREITGITVRRAAARLLPSRTTVSEARINVGAVEDVAPVVSTALETAPARVVAEPAPPANAAGKRNRGKEKGAKAGAEPAGTTKAAPPVAPFNPYGFSAMAVLLNEGRAALEAKLASAVTLEQITQLAEAQSVRIAPEILSAKPVDLQKLRAAFIDAVQQRIAHRRAVSSA